MATIAHLSCASCVDSATIITQFLKKLRWALSQYTRAVSLKGKKKYCMLTPYAILFTWVIFKRQYDLCEYSQN